MYFPKVNIYHDNLCEDKRKTSTNKSRVCADEKKEKYNYDMEEERKTGPKKNTIVQMKKKADS